MTDRAYDLATRPRPLLWPARLIRRPVLELAIAADVYGLPGANWIWRQFERVEDALAPEWLKRMRREAKKANKARGARVLPP